MGDDSDEEIRRRMLSGEDHAFGLSAGLIARVEEDVRTSSGLDPTPARRGSAAPAGAPARISRRGRGFPGWAVAASVVLVAAVAGIVVFSALQTTSDTVGAPPPVPSSDPEPSASESPAPVYPELPATEVPLTADGLATCRLAANVFPLGQNGVDSHPQNLAQLAYDDLAAYLLTDFSDQIATTSPRPDAAGLLITPKTDGLDIDGYFASAAAALIPQLRELVSIDGILVSAPVAYSFDDLCRVYLAARSLADAARPGSGFALPWYSLMLSSVDAAVVMEVPHIVPPPIREMEARYGPLLRVDVMPPDYELPTLFPLEITPVPDSISCSLETLDQIRAALVGPVTDRGYGSGCSSAGKIEIEVQPGMGEQATKLLAPFASSVVVIESPVEFGLQSRG